MAVAEPPPIPSNAANLTPWTKSNFLGCEFPAIDVVVVDLLEDAANIVLEFPIWIVLFKTSQITDIPDVVATAVVFDVGRTKFIACDLFGHADGLQH